MIQSQDMHPVSIPSEHIALRYADAASVWRLKEEPDISRDMSSPAIMTCPIVYLYTSFLLRIDE
jgi:hypothetical protein